MRAEESRPGLSSCPTREQLEAFHHGRLADEPWEAISGHINDCARCEAVLEELHQKPDSLDRALRGKWPEGLSSGPGARPGSTSPEGESRPPPPGDGDAPAGEKPVIPGYQILGELGRGGMGVVYKARHIALDRLVAIKMIRDGALAGPEELARFHVEGQAVAQLQHPNIVQIHEIGEHQSRSYLSLEFIAGGSLAQKLNGTPLSARTAAELVEVLARAVQAAHAEGVLHRDLKPANVLLTEDGTPKITDFGLAKRLNGGSGASAAGQTQTGAILGTPSYMAPEQAAGRTGDIGPLADLYTLGAILYECLTGRPPFQAATVVETLEQVRLQEPVPPRRLQPRLPRDLETICLKCLQKKPQGRYATAQALADDLQRWLKGEAIVARPARAAERAWKWAKRRPAAAALLVVGAVATVALVGLAVGWIHYAGLQRALDTVTGANEEAEKARYDAQRQEALTKDSLARERSFYYLNRIMLAQRQWQAKQVAQARQMLDGCPEELRQWEWRYLDRLCHADRFVLKGHTEGVNCVVFSPDGQRLASASTDRTVRVWDLQSGQEVLVLKGHKGAVHGVAFSPDGKHLATSSLNEIRFWDTTTGKETLNCKGHNGHVLSVAFSPDGKYLASASGDKTVKLWDALTGQEVLTLRGHRGTVHSVAFSPDGKHLASVAQDSDSTTDLFASLPKVPGYSGKEFIIWHLDSVDKAFSVKLLSGPGESVAFRPNGRHVAIAEDRAVRFLEIGDGHPGQAELLPMSPIRHNYPVNNMAFSRDGNYLASAGGGTRMPGEIRKWDLKANKEILTLKQHSDEVTSLALSPDGKHLASASLDKTVRVWDLETGQEALTLQKHLNGVISVAFSPDGKRLASGSGDYFNLGRPSEVRVFEGQTGQETLTLQGHTNEAVNSMAFSLDGKRFAVASRGQVVGVWDLEKGQEVHALKGHTGRVNSVAFSPDGKRLASASHDKTVKLWDLETGREIFTLSGHTRYVLSVSFSPDGEQLASGSDDRMVKVWDTRTGQEVLTFTGHSGPVSSVCFSPDGQRIASGGWGAWDAQRKRVDFGELKVWSTHTGREVYTLQGHSSGIGSLCYSPDGQRLASASSDGMVKVWDTRIGQEAFTLEGHTGPVHCVTFSPDGHRLASGGGDRCVKVWNAAPLRLRLSP